MSPCSIPAPVSAAITAACRAEFWRIASAALAAWVVTPNWMEAMSGATRDSPVPATVRRDIPGGQKGRSPPSGWAMAGPARASAVEAARAIRPSGRETCVMSVHPSLTPSAAEQQARRESSKEIGSRIRQLRFPQAGNWGKSGPINQIAAAKNTRWSSSRQ